MLERLRSLACPALAVLAAVTLPACWGVEGMMRDECFHAKPLAEGMKVTQGSRATACVNVGDTRMGLSVLDERSSPDKKGARVAYTAGCRMGSDGAFADAMIAFSCRKLVEYHLADDDPELVRFATEKVVAAHGRIRSDDEVAADDAKRKAQNKEIVDSMPKTDWLGAVGAAAGAVASQPNAPRVNPKVMNTVKDAARTTEKVVGVIKDAQAASGAAAEATDDAPAPPAPARPRAGGSPPPPPSPAEAPAAVTASPSDASTPTLRPATTNVDPACTANASCDASQKMCNGGNAEACSGLGGLYANGILGVTKDEARAASLFLRACSANPASGGCLQLANLYASGKGVPQDKARAVALAKGACTAPKAVAAACSMVDSFGDHAFAMAHLRPLCDAGDWSGCAYLMADATEKPHAIQKLQEMCAAHNATACLHLKNSGL